MENDKYNLNDPIIQWRCKVEKEKSDKRLQAGLIFNKELEKGFNKQPSNKGLERLSKALKEMQRGIHG